MSIVFYAATGIFYFALGIVWSHVNFANILIKAFNFLLTFLSFYMVARHNTVAHRWVALYLVVVTIWSLVGFISWKTNSTLNRVVKTMFMVSAIFSLIEFLICVGPPPPRTETNKANGNNHSQHQTPRTSH